MSGLNMKSCDYGDCSDKGENISRLSPEGFLVATGNKAYSFREAYKRFHYCDSHHDLLMKNVWNRVRQNEDKDDDHVAPTAI
jgi:hypothetical protein